MTFVIESPTSLVAGHGWLREPFVVARCFLRLIRSFLANTQDKRKLAHATLRVRLLYSSIAAANCDWYRS
ncbi:hypothetical protein GCM10025789_20290 [Tessaracoccus lubricantis]|uniref:Transposase DDE domain-containing protein n=1 Tax=Tessaracoccus lubricantis TaxID=545543 RepID=A0ABP9FPX1_9ACTN